MPPVTVRPPPDPELIVAEPAGHERRGSQRLPALLVVSYAGRADPVSDYLHNVSGGGLFICTERALAVGEALDFEVSFPGLLAPLPCRGHVRWVRPPAQATLEEPAGVGVELDFPSDQHRQRLTAIVAALGQPLPADAPLLPFRVLVAEDNPLFHSLFRSALQRFLRAHNQIGSLQLVSVHDGREALAALQAGGIDLAIIDHFLPIAHGAEVIRQLRATPGLEHIPVLAVSAGTEDERRRCLEAGADLFLHKPLHLKQVLATLRLFLVKQVHRAAFEP